jgi:hypothetical protein
MDNVFIQVQIIYCKQETTVEEWYIRRTYVNFSSEMLNQKSPHNNKDHYHIWQSLGLIHCIHGMKK